MGGELTRPCRVTFEDEAGHPRRKKGKKAADRPMCKRLRSKKGGLSLKVIRLGVWGHPDFWGLSSEAVARVGGRAGLPFARRV